MPRSADSVLDLRRLLLAGVFGLLMAGGVQAGVAPVDARAEPPTGVSSQDWTSIRAAYDAGRHAIEVDDEGALVARNPGQQWITRFDRRGFTVTPDAGGWTWGLELRSIGFAGMESAIGEGSPSVSHQHGELNYDWSPALREWFVNDARGLQQGWTINDRPARSKRGAALRLELTVRGGLVPRVSTDEKAVSFHTANGGSALSFGGLKAWDADGKTLAVRFEQAGDTALRVAVDEHGARYPITIDPTAQQAYLKASNTEASDNFGFSVAVSGDTVVVGAIGEDSNATGVDGNQGDNTADGSGAVYVFVRNGSTWTQQAYLKASNTGAFDSFGQSVAVSGDTVVVGAPSEASNATGVDGDQNNNSLLFPGAAYVFARSGTTWTQQAYLKASNTNTQDLFGESVAVSGDTVVVGARRESSNATGVDGNQSDNSARDSGAAYVFVRNGATWSQQAYLKASNSNSPDFEYFGYSVAASGDTVVVGAYNEYSNATGVNGNQSDISAGGSGAAYVFVRNVTTWSQQAYLKSSNTEANDAFGLSVGLSGDTLVIGAPSEDSNALGVDGNQGDNNADGAGAAYVFSRSGTTWTPQAYLKASNTDGGDQFGWSVATSGGAIIVGAPGERSNATGINGDQANNSVFNAGAVYVFARSGTAWTQQAYVKGSNTEGGDYFGYSLAFAGETAVVGAWQEDSSAIGVNGNQADNSAGFSGAAYVVLIVVSIFQDGFE